MEEEIDLMDMIKYFWNKKIWIILIGVLCVILAVVYTKFFITPKYTATSTFILTNDELKTEAEVYSYAKLPDRYYAITNSTVVVEKAVSNLKMDDIKDIEKFKKSNVEITHFPANFLIVVTVKKDDAKEAADMANEIVKVAIEEIKTTYNDDKLQVLEYARENWESVNVKMNSNILKFVIVGEAIVCGYILILYMFVEGRKKEKLKYSEEKERVSIEYKKYETEILASIKKSKKYIELIEERKMMEKRINKSDCEKIFELYDELLKNCAEDAYTAGYIDAKNKLKIDKK